MILSFYSYKGGVGRTSLTVDIAARLARGSQDRPPLRVLLWDLDLDAPGVAHFPALMSMASSAEIGTRDLFSLLREDPRSVDASAVTESEVLALLRRAVVSDETIADGRLSLLLPAGSETMKSGDAFLDPASLFGPNAPGPRLLALVADLARRELGYDVVFVDARTGINDLSATATTVLADCAVLVFRLDGQDLSHLSEIVNAIHEAWGRAGASPTDLPNRLYRVANLVPSGHPDIVEAVDSRRRELAEMRLEPHVELGLRPLALVRESTPSLDGTLLDPESHYALEGLADWVYERRTDLARRDGEGTAATRSASSSSAGTTSQDRLEKQVKSLLELGGWQVHEAQEASSIVVLRAKKLGEFRRRHVLLIGCVSSRGGATALQVEALSSASTVIDDNAESMLVARRFGARAAEAAERRNVLLVRPEDLLDEQAPAEPLRQRARELWEGTALERQYVSPTAVQLNQEGRPAGKKVNLDNYALRWLHRKQSGLLCVLGDFGAGKTTFCLRLAAELTKDSHTSASPLPLTVDLRSAGSTALTLDGLLRHALDQAKLDQSRLDPWRYRLANGSLVLLVDGFDELLGYTDPERMEGLLEELQQAASEGPVILTSRSSYFRSDRDAARRLHGRRATSKKAAGTALWTQLQSSDEVTAVEVQPFTDAQIQAYLARRFGTQHVSEILARLRALHPVDDLLRRPYLLTLVATSIDQWEERGWPDRLTLTTVYESYVADWLARDERKHRGLPVEPASLAQHLARVLWNRQGGQIGSRALRREVAQWGSAMSGRVISPDEEESIEAKVRTALFLVRDERGDYRFAHRSFLEFFVAKDLAERLSGSLDVEAVQSALEMSRLTPEIATFLAGWPDSWARLPQACDLVLSAAPTRPLASTNALLLRLWHGRAQQPQAELASITIEIPRAELPGVDLSGVDLAGAALRGANLSGADLSRADLTGADLSKANLHAAVGRNVNLTRAKLQAANLSAADFIGARLVDSDFTEADLSLADLREVHASRIVLTGSSLQGARLSQAQLSSAVARRANFQNATLAGAVLDDADLTNAVTDGVDVRFASLRGAQLSCVPPSARGARIAPSPSDIEGASLSHLALPEPGFMAMANSSVIVACADGALRAWDLETDEISTLHSLHTGPLNGLAAVESHGVQTIFSCEDELIIAWTLGGTQALASRQVDKATTIAACEVLLGDAVLAVGEGEVLRILSADLKTQLAEIKTGGDISAIALVPERRTTVVVGRSDGTLALWDLGTCESLGVFDAHSDEINVIIPLPGAAEGPRLFASAGDDAEVRIWDLEQMVPVLRLVGHTDWIYALSSLTLPHGGAGLASAGDDEIVRVWDLATAEQIVQFRGHDAWIRGLVTVPLSDGSAALASVAEDGSIRLWDLDGNAGTLAVLSAPTGEVNSLTPAPVAGGGRGVVALYENGTAALWDMEEYELDTVLSTFEPLRALAPFRLPDGIEGLAAGDDNFVSFWDTAARKRAAVVAHSCDELTALCQVHDQTGSPLLACGGAEGAIRLLDFASREPLGAIGRQQASVSAMCEVRADDAILVTAGVDGALLARTISGAESDWVVGFHEAPITALCALPSTSGRGLVAAGDAGGRVAIWSAMGAGCLAEVNQGGGPVLSVAERESENGLVIVSASKDGAIRQWQPFRKNPEEVEYQRYPDRLVHICPLKSGDDPGAVVAGGADGAIRVLGRDGAYRVTLVGAAATGDWLAYRGETGVEAHAPAAWGTEAALNALLVVGRRWRASDLRHTHPRALLSRKRKSFVG